MRPSDIAVWIISTAASAYCGWLSVPAWVQSAAWLR